MKKILKIALIMTLIDCSVAFGQDNNPLLSAWNTPHQTPPFSKIENKHYLPALREAMKQADINIDNIINSKSAPTFENTILALEQATEGVDRISNILFNLNECNTSKEMQDIVMEILPELTQFSNRITMNEKLFARVQKIYNSRDSYGFTTEQLTLVENYYKSFIRNGVGLNENDKVAYAKYTEELSRLTQQFNQNVLADNNAYFLNITNEKDLAGLPENAIAAAKEEAAARGKQGWVFTLDYPSYGPFMTYCDNRELRRQMWTAYNSRGNRGNENDNNDIIHQITKLRLKQAQLLGYKNYCDYILSDRMAQSSPNLKQFMTRLVDASLPAAKDDLIAVANFARNIGFQEEIQRWDFSYYSEKLKLEKYQFDPELLRPYFPLDKVRQGIFDLYGKLYGLKFVESKTIEPYHPDVKVFEVFDGKRFMGVLYLDMHPRASKRGGAWMTEFRGQSNINGNQVRPLIQVVCNFSKPTAGKPALLSFDEVETFMHEMGHAMHGMLSDVTYPSISGTNVKRDFVELPSQIMENWCYESAFLNSFARHYITGDTIPSEYIKKIKESENYLAGYLSVRQLSLGLVDIAYHSLFEKTEDNAEQFEQKHMIELLPPVPGCNTSTSFTHIFAGGYASGYYGYKWAEVLDADAFSKFKAEGIFNKETATRFRETILSKGGTQHPAILFRDFMGRDPNPDALLKRSGFIK